MEQTENKKTTGKKQEYPKASLAILIAIVSLGLSIFNLTQKPRVIENTPETFIQRTAIELGIRSKTYEQCIANNTIQQQVIDDITELNKIAEFAQLDGIGTPFNLIITNEQVIPMNGNYPYEAFEFLINEITTKGVASEAVLESLQTSEMNYAVTGIIRPFDIENDHYKGSENPSITLIEYSDLECPYCAAVHGTLESLVANHSELTWVYRHFPLSFHEQAMPAAIASECVAEESGNEAFWTFATEIFENQNKLQ